LALTTPIFYFKEMMLAYVQLKKDIPQGRFLFEPTAVKH
jgi:hypothetical protein